MGKVNVRKRGTTWEYRFEAAKIGGSRKQISKGGFKTQGEALKAGTAALNEYNNTGYAFKPSELSVSDYLDYWLNHSVKPNLSYNTYINYERYIRVHLKPAFGSYRLNALSNNPAAIQDWITSLKTKGYSRSMITNILYCLSGALNYAVIPCKYISSNPCTYVKVPAIKADQEKKAHKEYVCSTEDFKKIITRFDSNSNFYIPLMLGYYLGTRIGESYAIDLMRDIDYDNMTISINRQIQKEGKNWIYKNPKYDSFRTLKSNKEILDILKHETIKQKKNRLKYGEYYIKSYVDEHGKIIQLPASIDTKYSEIMPVSVRENGELLTPDSFKYCAKVIHNELNNPLFHSHCLRHTHGTILAENGINPKAVMERLGHKDISTTLQTYTFNTEKMQDACVNVFDGIFVHA